MSADKLKEIAMTASDRVYEQDDLGPSQSIKQSLSFIASQINTISKFLQDNELQFTTSKDEKVLRHIKFVSELVAVT